MKNKALHNGRLATMLYRSLEHLSLAIESCASIGFQESSPTKNAHHASIWNNLNDAQKDAKLKLKHYQQFIDEWDANIKNLAQEIRDSTI